MGYEMPILHKLYEFYKVLYGYIKTFPKKDRYTLGQKCENITLEILETIILAQFKSQPARLQVLEKISPKLDLLKIMIRLAKDVQALSPKSYLLLEKELQEIGKMLGGWIKSLKTKGERWDSEKGKGRDCHSDSQDASC